jgi:hypothetical protein
MQLSVCRLSWQQHTVGGYRRTPPCSFKSYLFSLLLRDLGDTIPSCLQQDTRITTLVCMKVFISAYTTTHTHISLLFTHPADIYSLLDDNPWLKNIPYNFYPDSSLLCLCTERGSGRTELAPKLVIWLKNVYVAATQIDLRLCSVCLLCPMAIVSVMSNGHCACYVQWPVYLLCPMASVPVMSNGQCICYVQWQVCLLCPVATVSVMSSGQCVCYVQRSVVSKLTLRVFSRIWTTSNSWT